MNHDIPSHLASTIELINRAYPQGVPESDYLSLLSILAEHLAEGNVSMVASHLRRHVHPEDLNDSAAYLNDVLFVKSRLIDSEAVMAKLVEAGYEDWVEED